MSITDAGLERLVFLKGTLLKAASLQKVAGQQSVDRVNALLLFDYAVQGLLYLILSEKGSPSSYPGPASAYLNKVAMLENSPMRKGNVMFRRLCDEVTALARNNPAWNLNDIPHKQELLRIHHARNDCQHDFTVPSPEDLQRYHSYIESMFDQVVDQIFHTDFGSLSYHSLVADAKLRARLLAAEERLEQRKYVNAVDYCAVAVEEAIQRRMWAFPLHRTENMPGGRLIPPTEAQHPVRAENSFFFTWLQYTAIGINHADAQRFYLMAPSVSFSASGIIYLDGYRANLTCQDAEFALHFAADVVRRLEDLGLAPNYITGEWLPPDEERRLKDLVPDWQPDPLRTLE